MRSFAKPGNTFITGASRGIGLALVRTLLTEPGTSYLFAASRQATSDEILAGLASDSAGRLIQLDLDVTDELSVANAAAVAGAQVTHLDLVINCAGLLHGDAGLRPEKRLADVCPSSFQRSVAVNALGPLLVAKYVQRLLARDTRCVFASLSARVGSISDNRLGGWYAYRASKAAQNMITRNLSIELRRRSRSVICVALHPGTVDTELSRPFQRNVAQENLFTPDGAARQLLRVIAELDLEDNGRFLAWDGQPIPW